MSNEDGAVKTILGLSEEKMGEVVSQLLSNDAFVSAMQRAISSSVSAKKNLDKGVSTVLSMVNVPTLDDVQKIRDRLTEVEQAFADIASRLEALNDKLDG